MAEYEKNLPGIDELDATEVAETAGINDKKKDYLELIDGLVFRLPDHDFNVNLSSGSIPLRLIESGFLPREFMKFFYDENVPGFSRIYIAASDRGDRGTYVSISTKERKIKFAINPVTGSPELFFEHRKEDGWEVQGESEPITWEDVT